MVITAIENFIEKFKIEERLEFARREQDHLNSQELIKSYHTSDRARYVLNSLNDELFLVMKEIDDKKDDRTDEEKQISQQCFGLMAKCK